ncbi:hypothetical protein GGX14DRAFT_482414, partial [Mycena pura]
RGGHDKLSSFFFTLSLIIDLLLNNITLALVEGSAEDNGNSVIDIMVANLSSAITTSFSYTLFPGIPSGTYHARLTGTIYNGDTILAGNSSASALSNTFSIPDSGVPCSAGTFTPVTSVTDPAYSPVRITAPVGGDVLVQSLLTADLEPTTVEVINTQTGFTAGGQHTQLELDATILYMTNNVTLDVGSWKVRMNFTVHALSNYPGVFSLQSEEFFVVAASGDSPNCTSSSSSSSSTASGSGGIPASTNGASAPPSGSTPTQNNQPSASATSGGANPAQSSSASSQNAAPAPVNPLQNLWICVFISIFVLINAGGL